MKKPPVTDVTNGQIQSFDQSLTPLLPDYMDPAVCYLPNGAYTSYYYGSGFDGNGNGWEDYSRYIKPDGVEMPNVCFLFFNPVPRFLLCMLI